jgi:FkbM family methyltransferase
MNTTETLKDLLAESVSSAKERERHAFPELSGTPPSAIVLFGAGDLGRRTLRGLRRLGIEPAGFADNNQALWDKTVDGVTVFPPDEAFSLFDKAVFVLTVWSDAIGHPMEEIKRRWPQDQTEKILPFAYLFWKYPDIFLPYFSLDLPHKTLEQRDLVERAFPLWADPRSRQEYLAQIRWRLHFDYAGLLEPAPQAQYFPEDLVRLSPDETVVDCGAFDGDTLKSFLQNRNGSFKRYLAYEPDPANFHALQAFVSSLPGTTRSRIALHQAAVGSHTGKTGFCAAGSPQSAIAQDGGSIVDCVSLDEAVYDARPTFIKTDAEGSEPDIITGAAKTIRDHLPVLALSCYHQFDHLWRLPLAVRELSDQYVFFLRSHRRACWDLVCYAVPLHRIIAKK